MKCCIGSRVVGKAEPNGKILTKVRAEHGSYLTTSQIEGSCGRSAWQARYKA